MIGKFARKYTTIGDDPVFGGNACRKGSLPSSYFSVRTSHVVSRPLD
jgi:hypothetical protein